MGIEIDGDLRLCLPSSRGGSRMNAAVAALSRDAVPLRWLSDAKLRRTYLAFGDAVPLSRDLTFLSGARAAAERIALALLPRLGLSPPVTDPALLAGWAGAAAALNPRAALLLHTGWYKATLFVGPVTTSDGETLFIKLFAEQTAAAAEARRAEAARALVEPFFRAASVRLINGPLVAYELIRHGRVVPEAGKVERSIADMGRAALERSTESRPARAIVDLESLAGRLSELGLPPPPRTLDGDEAEPLAAAHGDCTPWNIFADEAGRACLIDYERQGAATPFADLFHYRVQPQAVRGRIEPAAAVLDGLTCLTGHSRTEMARWFGLYLAAQLELDLGLWFDEGRRHRQLRALIAAKSALLAATDAELRAAA